MENSIPNFTLLDDFKIALIDLGIDFEIKGDYKTVSSIKNANLVITSSLEILKKSKPNRYTIFVNKKDSDIIIKALNLRADRYILFDEIETIYKSIDEIKEEFFLQKIKDYNNFMLSQYKKAIDSSNIVSKTDKRGIITYVNDEFCKISGYTKAELLGKNHNIVRHPDVPKEKFEHFWNVILNKNIWKGTVKNRAKDGSTFYVNTTVIPIIDYKDEIVEFVAIRYDVTKNIELQERLQKKELELELLNLSLEKKVKEQTKKLIELNANLEERVKKEVKKNREKDRLMFQQAKLASLGEMLGNIAHQWRQPLMELSILLYKAKKSGGVDDVYKRANNIIERMNQTIIDFQNFFNPDKEKEQFNISEVIRHSLSIIEGSLEKNKIEVRLNLDEDLDILGYKNEFSQVILNLVNNAKENFIQKGIEKREILIEAFRKEGHIFIEVSDSGGGIDVDIIENIFEPYFTTKDEGTGLGLYMSNMIIKRGFKGSLGAKNIKNGAKFSIKIKA